MRVICINEKWEGEPAQYGLKHPQVGDIDEAVDVIDHNGSKYYRLLGYDYNRGFRCDFFATLPDASADEMADESREAIANLETVLV